MRGLQRRLEPVALARTAAARWTEAAAYVAAALACLLFAGKALDRHRSFESNAYDFGFFDQIIWNTSQGRWFESSFIPYNFLGQHFQPVLLVFALVYRLGAGNEVLLPTQAFVVAAAALPLYYAVRRATSSGVVGLMMSAGFLLSAPLHRGLDFDFHPELMGYVFVFLAAYFLVADRPVATIAALLPLLLLKEDMPLILAAFAVLLFVRGFRREGSVLLAGVVVYAIAVVVVLMPWIRGGSGDLTERYGYLVADSTWLSLGPHIVSRALEQLWGDPLAGAVRLGASTGFIGLLNPLAALVAAPSVLLATLSDHPQQSRLQLHYAMAPLALSWVAAVLGVERVTKIIWSGRLPLPHGRSLVTAAAGLLVLGSSVFTFVFWSPYAPGAERRAPDTAHRAILSDALTRIPPDVAVSAQNTILPHLSSREAVFEFPELHNAAYVIVDPSLPVTDQARQAGYAAAIASLPDRGFELIFDREGVKVFRRTR